MRRGSRARGPAAGRAHRGRPPAQRAGRAPADATPAPARALSALPRHRPAPQEPRVRAASCSQQLRALGWPGSLVLAGPPASFGGTAEQERPLRERLAPYVFDAGTPDEPAKAWLYAHAAAALYPTTYEGFGLIPFEAAAHGVPTLFAPQASLTETLAGADTLVPWDAAASAVRVRPLLDAGPDRERHVEQIRTAGERFTWDATARALLPIYEETLALPAELGWNALQVEGERREWEHRYWTLFNGIGPTGLSLVSGDQRLLEEDAQRTLAALARRPATRKLLLSMLNAARRVSKR